MSTAAAAGLQGTLRVTVPFSFHAGQVVLPAGQYSIEQLSTPWTLLIRGKTTSNLIYVRAIPAQKDQREPSSRLVFNKYGDHYFLAQIWSGGTRMGAQLPGSKREREMSTSLHPDRVVLALGK